MGTLLNQLFTKIRQLKSHPYVADHQVFIRESFIGIGLTLGVWMMLVWTMAPTSIQTSEGTVSNALIPPTLNLPESIYAGKILDVDVGINDTTLRMMTITSWGVFIVAPTPRGKDQISFRLDSAITRQSGLITLRLLNANGQLTTDSLEIKPLSPAEPLETYIGSKSIIADGGKHWAMITALPMDSLGNPVAEGTPTLTQFYRPDGRVEKRTGRTKNLVSFERINSGLTTGKTIVGVRVGGAIGKEKELLEIPGYPVPFKINSKNVYPFADERQNFLVETSKLKDQYGNTVAEGTLIYFKVSDPDQSQRLLTAYTLDGVARIYLQNPAESGSLSIQASVYGQVESNRLTLTFAQAIRDFKVTYNQETRVLMVGPMIGPLNQYAPDGSVVYAELRGTDQKTTLNLNAPVLDGYAQFDLSTYPAVSYTGTLRFNGTEKKVKFANGKKE